MTCQTFRWRENMWNTTEFTRDATCIKSSFNQGIGLNFHATFVPDIGAVESGQTLFFIKRNILIKSRFGKWIERIINFSTKMTYGSNSELHKSYALWNLQKFSKRICYKVIIIEYDFHSKREEVKTIKSIYTTNDVSLLPQNVEQWQKTYVRK